LHAVVGTIGESINGNNGKQADNQYSRFMFALTEADIDLNRKMLSDMAVADPAAFDAIVEVAMAQVEAA
jgi:ribosomal protein L20